MNMDLGCLSQSICVDATQGDMLCTSIQKLMEVTSDIVFVKDINLRYIAGSPSFSAVAGKASMSEILGRTDADIFENQDMARAYTADDRRVLDSGKDMIDHLEQVPDLNGMTRFCSTSKYILRDATGKAKGILGISRDVTLQIKGYRKYDQVVDTCLVCRRIHLLRFWLM